MADVGLIGIPIGLVWLNDVLTVNASSQIVSATADWVMWLTLADQQVFSTVAARVGVLASIPTHYSIGLLLVLAIRSASQTRSAHVPAVAQG